MSKRFVVSANAMLALLTLAPILCAQTDQPPGVAQQLKQRKWNNSPPVKAEYNAKKKTAPAPRRDLWGLWDGTAEGGIQVTIPALPACRVEAATRDDAIRLAREAIAQLVRRSEVVQVEIPEQPRATGVPHETPWAWFGTAREDPTWDALFDEIEQHREATQDTD